MKYTKFLFILADLFKMLVLKKDVGKNTER